ncbi:hypothetical protein [Psychromicrobium sp. YIM B11713]|uniref:hypothetical protein n=1 Tax=Psychromicrobium sp. YIM B11713 TaxID=3145233 RepID=UPI00374F4439
MSDPYGQQQPPSYPTPNGSYPPAAGADFPGKTLGIVGLVCSIVFGIVGLIISIIANNQSKTAGFKNTPAFIGIIIGIIVTVLGIIWFIFIMVLAANFSNSGYPGYNVLLGF